MRWGGRRGRHKWRGREEVKKSSYLMELEDEREKRTWDEDGQTKREEGELSKRQDKKKIGDKNKRRGKERWGKHQERKQEGKQKKRRHTRAQQLEARKGNERRNKDTMAAVEPSACLRNLREMTRSISEAAMTRSGHILCPWCGTSLQPGLPPSCWFSAGVPRTKN